jgi:hypothetical protein
MQQARTCSVLMPLIYWRLSLLMSRLVVVLLLLLLLLLVPLLRLLLLLLRRLLRLRLLLLLLLLPRWPGGLFWGCLWRRWDVAWHHALKVVSCNPQACSTFVCGAALKDPGKQHAFLSALGTTSRVKCAERHNTVMCLQESAAPNKLQVPGLGPMAIEDVLMGVRARSFKAR